MPIEGVLAIAFDQSGRAWLGTGTHGVIIFDGQRFLHYTTADGLPVDYVSAIATDAAGDIWIGGSGVSRFTPD